MKATTMTTLAAVLCWSDVIGESQTTALLSLLLPFKLFANSGCGSLARIFAAVYIGQHLYRVRKKYSTKVTKLILRFDHAIYMWVFQRFLALHCQCAFTPSFSRRAPFHYSAFQNLKLFCCSFGKAVW